MTTYSGKLVHDTKGRAHLTIEASFVNSDRADKFLSEMVALLQKHDIENDETSFGTFVTD